MVTVGVKVDDVLRGLLDVATPILVAALLVLISFDVLTIGLEVSDVSASYKTVLPSTKSVDSDG